MKLAYYLGVMMILTMGLGHTANPNVIVIFADDMGYGDLQCYGGKIKTPHFDRLASEGMRFTNAYVPASVCSPSRYSLLSGRYFWRNPRHPQSGVIKPGDPIAFNPGELTIQKMFQENGYQTSAFGKWHIGMGENETDWTAYEIQGGPCDHGFDYFYGTAGNFGNIPQIFIENRTFTGRQKGDKVQQIRREDVPWKYNVIPWDESVIYKDDELAGDVNEQVVKYIENAPTDKPFFVYYPTHIPHKPITPNKRFSGQSGLGAYGDFILELDTYLGEVLQALKKSGRIDNTLIIFTSDNGGVNPENEAHAKKWGLEKYWDALAQGHDINGPFRHGKHFVQEGGFRVPFIVWWPGHIPAGRTSDQLICSTDIMSTCASLLDHELPADAAVDGLDMLPLWTGESQKSKRDYVILCASESTFAIRRGRWKFIEKNNHDLIKAKPSSRSDQLYDLKNDCGEKNNLINDYPEVVKELRDILNKERSQVKGANGVKYPRSDKKLAKVKTCDTGLIKNGKFENDMKGWRTWKKPQKKNFDVSFTERNINGKGESAISFVTHGAGERYDFLQLIQDLPDLEQGAEYKFSFNARITKGEPTRITPVIRRKKDPKIMMPGCQWPKVIGTDWTKVNATFEATKMDAPIFLSLGLGKVAGAIELADFKMIRK